jgi:hypothetical protein
MYKLRTAFPIFILKYMPRIKLIGLIAGLGVILTAVCFSWRPVTNAIGNRINVYRFENMDRGDMISDFEFLMDVLEENWPFFNLSISANGIDVRELADNTRAVLNDPSTEINNPLDFLDLIQEHFFIPINQFAHLRPTWRHEDFFNSFDHYQHRIEWGVESRSCIYYYNLFTQPQTVMFYTRMRDTGRGSSPPQPDFSPVMRFDILEDERTAYIRINRMINIWDDTYSLFDPNRWHYEMLMYNFNQQIEGFEHLIIDLRGNPGGRSLQFDNFVMPNFLREAITLPAYIFYMGGEYAALAREVFDIRDFYPTWVYLNMTKERLDEIEKSIVPMETHFNESLVNLDKSIDFTHIFMTNYGIVSGQENTSFDGKIWLLTDNRTASVTEAVTAILKYNDIVTVVGEPTYGVMGVTYDPTTITISLPNTGILVRFDVAYYTDLSGRPFQGYGIQPHYHNRPGMGALETVLAMIEEGGYQG